MALFLHQLVFFLQKAQPMKSSLWLVNFGFVPRSFDLALLFLRVAAGVSMLVLHGWEKFITFPAAVENFGDPLGIGRHLSLVLVVFAEVFCSLLLIGGIVTRLAAAVLIINMSVALFKVHGGDVAGAGEKAALYLYAYITILIAGAGRFSADGAGGPFALAGFGMLAGAIGGYPLSYYFQGSGYKDGHTVSEYLASFKSVLRDEALRGTAIGVWIGAVFVLGLAGYLVGRAMNRRVVRSVEQPPKAPPDLT